LGIISQNVRIRSVIAAVETPIARDSWYHEASATSIAILAAKDAISVFTRLFPMRIVIKSLSVFFLSFWSVTAQNFFFFTRASML
jgi:hypothetical protein